MRSALARDRNIAESFSTTIPRLIQQFSQEFASMEKFRDLGGSPWAYYLNYKTTNFEQTTC